MKIKKYMSCNKSPKKNEQGEVIGEWERHQLLGDDDEVYLCGSPRATGLVGKEIPKEWVDNREYPKGSGQIQRWIKFPSAFTPSKGGGKDNFDPTISLMQTVINASCAMAGSIFGTKEADHWVASKVKTVIGACVDAVLQKIPDIRHSITGVPKPDSHDHLSKPKPEPPPKKFTAEEAGAIARAEEQFNGEIIDTTGE